MDNGEPDFRELKERLHATWTAGDYGKVAEGLEEGARRFFRRLDLNPGERVLDVACGSGQVALLAAASGAKVTGVDLAPVWIEQARARAASAGLEAQFDVGDAEDLPYEDEGFDLTISLIGAMFAPRPERVTAELLRVTRPGGRIVLGNWTPESFVGDFFRTVGRHVPPPDMPSPLLWGDEATVEQRLGAQVAELWMTRLPYELVHAEAPEEVVGFYREHFGPLKQAFAALDADAQSALQADLMALWTGDRVDTSEGTRAQSEILEVVAIKPTG
ncbi:MULTISPECIES: class I SAM-dependent methyltransferase [unclassified Wenzhouxiangella]|uniref:class I SAM-dependent methyltransferase n=1 Tax=unclassified Wenzhouxiangella TaxID=2613841 RepID=UPI000E32A430|nr:MULTISPECIES: class I SAM-dependent methyltransferase [unclassified Wenzhouxiangella]RFF27437.1 class I SAM-dependent methyltransferase [Wenzhouxiangella sp. 15181]RFP68865.1 class I SAM-dependent methyltransferase [Wenzhouxiangella sp. 15190]